MIGRLLQLYKRKKKEDKERRKMAEKAAKAAGIEETDDQQRKDKKAGFFFKKRNKSKDKENKENQRHMSRDRSRDRLMPPGALDAGANNSGSASDILLSDAYGELRASKVARHRGAERPAGSAWRLIPAVGSLLSNAKYVTNHSAFTAG